MPKKAISTAAKVQKSRDYRPHAEALYGAQVLLRFAAEERDGRFYEWMGALLLSAFAFEGYLNYLGRKVFPSWESFERSLSWHSKAKLIADRIEFCLDEGHRPFQTVKQLFAFRDNMAHPKPAVLRDEYETDKLDFRFWKPIQSDVENFCNEANAKRCIDDVEEMIMLLYDQAKVDRGRAKVIGGHPLIRGIESGSAGPATSST